MPYTPLDPNVAHGIQRFSQHMEVYDLTLVRRSSPVGEPVSSPTAIDRLPAAG
jgi:hypothetical protein